MLARLLLQKSRMKKAASSPSPATAATPTRGRPRSEKSRMAVLKAAQQLLEKGSLRDLSIEAIAQRAGVSKATIYRWWPGKTAIAIDVFDELLKPAAPPAGQSGSMKAIQRNQDLVARQYAGEVGRLIAQILCEVQSDQQARDAFINRVFMQRRAVLRTILTRGQASGELAAPADTDATLDLLYGAIYLRLLVGHLPLDDAFIASLQSMAAKLLAPSQLPKGARPASASRR